MIIIIGSPTNSMQSGHRSTYLQFDGGVMSRQARNVMAAVAAVTLIGATVTIPSAASAAPKANVTATVRAEKITTEALLKVARKGNKVAKSARSAMKLQQ